uniref:Uncharacterized protein n=1 Tax=Ralstonia solanacearum TaxID=305 RepID=A0A0S4U1V9_RALSL|nr:protein of unknown function [Ralstonia solanacearum]CUV21846.1 protein of unknown function [Ralstonia solanacearum]CUV28607.1 protein of unknown function [Ralstonia solanacearum]CUV35391.1 protein of unknown function [Ralstonia solanacearum]CUV40868.1 protein of unknown function [Ralstonia solanacearum]
MEIGASQIALMAVLNISQLPER